MFKRLLSKRRSIRQQLVIGVALVHAALMTIFIVDLVIEQRALLHEQHVQRNSGLVQGIARHAAIDLLSGDIAALHEIVQGYADFPELQYVVITDAAGKVLAHTDATLVGQYMVDPISLSMLNGHSKIRALVDNDDLLDLSMPVEWNQQRLGWVRFAAGMQANQQGLRTVAKGGAIYALVAIAIGVALAMWMARTVTRRLYQLLGVADATRTGRRDLRADADEVNEVGRLAGSFNAMLDALQEREHALERVNVELEERVARRTAALRESEETQRAILEQANDAFVSIDERGCIVNWNGMAETIFGWSRQQALGATLADLIIPPALREAHTKGMQRYLATGEERVLNRRVELTACRRDGSQFLVEMSLRVRPRAGERFFDAFLHDITERKTLERQLEAQALQDMLTGLPNRRALMAFMPLAMARAERSRQALAVMFLDLDGFKGVNDRHGHEAGDEVLREFSRRLRHVVRATDMVARLAGDEFVVIAESLSNPEDAQTIAAKILAAACEPFMLGAQPEVLSSSIGIKLHTPGSHSLPDELLSHADDAMYAAKRLGKCRSQLWRPEMVDIPAAAI